MDPTLEGKVEGGWTFESNGKVAKSEEAEIGVAISNNFLLSHLNDSQRGQVIAAMEACTVGKEATVIQKGEPGDWFYIVKSGSYDVRIDGQTVFQYVMEEHGANPSFGELALLYSKPRAASIICSEGGVLWRLHRSTFKEIVLRSSTQMLMKTLRSVEVLKFLSTSQLSRLVDTLSETQVTAGEVVIRQGEAGKEFYVIMEGEARVTIRDPESPGGEREVMQLKQYDYFGERALLSDSPRAATVKATTKMVLLHISKGLFEEILGPLEGIIESHRQAREEAAKQSYLQRQAEGMLDASIEDFKPIAVASYLPSEMHSYFIAKHTGSGTNYTLRVTSKVTTVKSSKAKKVMAEAQVWGQCSPNATLPPLLATFSDRSALYAVFGDGLGEGQVVATELREVLGDGLPTEAAVRFYVAGVLLAVNHLHLQDVIYRAISVDSVQLNSRGYPQLFDFTLSKNVLDTGRTYTLCGTPDYLSPEQVNQSGHAAETDYWALGVLAYELSTGESPWGNDKPEVQIYQAITAHKFGKLGFSGGAVVDDAGKAFINELMHHETEERLGCKSSTGIDDIGMHPWYKVYMGSPGKLSGFDQILAGSMPAPHASQCQAALDSMTSSYTLPAPSEWFPVAKYFGDDRPFEDWDFLASAGYTVESAKK